MSEHISKFPYDKHREEHLKNQKRNRRSK